MVSLEYTTRCFRRGTPKELDPAYDTIKQAFFGRGTLKALDLASGIIKKYHLILPEARSSTFNAPRRNNAYLLMP